MITKYGNNNKVNMGVMKAN